MIDQLKDSTKNLLPKIVSNDLTIVVDGSLIFLTHVFKSGHIMGFYSHSPWGSCHDKEQGNLVIDPKGNCVEIIETKIDGMKGGEDFKEWRAMVKECYGKAIKLTPEGENELFWKKEGL